MGLVTSALHYMMEHDFDRKIRVWNDGDLTVRLALFSKLNLFYN